MDLIKNNMSNIKKLTLLEYHKKYPKRPGDTVEKFFKYERFCSKNPLSKNEDYHLWYSRLAAYMEK